MIVSLFHFENKFRFYLPAGMSNGSILLYTGVNKEPLKLLHVPALVNFSFDYQFNKPLIPDNSYLLSLFKDNNFILAVRSDSASLFRRSNRLLLQNSLYDKLPVSQIQSGFKGLCILNTNEDSIPYIFTLYGNYLYIVANHNNRSIAKVFLVDLSKNEKAAMIIQTLYKSSNVGAGSFYVNYLDNSSVSISMYTFDLGVFECEVIDSVFTSPIQR